MFVVRRFYDGFATPLYVDNTGNYSSLFEDIRLFSREEALHYIKTRTFLLNSESLVIEKI